MAAASSGWRIPGKAARGAPLTAQHCLICRIETRLCALPLVHVLEVMRPLPLERIEGAPHFVLGLAVIRGEPLPVVDVAALLSGVPSPKVSRFVAVRVGDRHVALAVAEVLGTRTIERQLLGQTPPLLSQAAPGVEALGTLDGALLATLDSARVLDELGLGARGQA